MADKVNKDITNGFWEISDWKSLRRGYCLIGEMTVERVSMGKVAAGELHSGKCQSVNCIGRRSYNQV